MFTFWEKSLINCAKQINRENTFSEAFQGKILSIDMTGHLRFLNLSNINFSKAHLKGDFCIDLTARSFKVEFIFIFI